MRGRRGELCRGDSAGANLHVCVRGRRARAGAVARAMSQIFWGFNPRGSASVDGDVPCRRSRRRRNRRRARWTTRRSARDECNSKTTDGRKSVAASSARWVRARPTARAHSADGARGPCGQERLVEMMRGPRDERRACDEAHEEQSDGASAGARDSRGSPHRRHRPLALARAAALSFRPSRHPSHLAGARSARLSAAYADGAPPRRPRVLLGPLVPKVPRDPRGALPRRSRPNNGPPRAPRHRLRRRLRRHPRPTPSESAAVASDAARDARLPARAPSPRTSRGDRRIGAERRYALSTAWESWTPRRRRALPGRPPHPHSSGVGGEAFAVAAPPQRQVGGARIPRGAMCRGDVDHMFWAARRVAPERPVPRSWPCPRSCTRPYAGVGAPRHAPWRLVRPRGDARGEGSAWVPNSRAPSRKTRRLSRSRLAAAAAPRSSHGPSTPLRVGDIVPAPALARTSRRIAPKVPTRFERAGALAEALARDVAVGVEAAALMRKRLVRATAHLAQMRGGGWLELAVGRTTSLRLHGGARVVLGAHARPLSEVDRGALGTSTSRSRASSRSRATSSRRGLPVGGSPNSTPLSSGPGGCAKLEKRRSPRGPAGDGRTTRRSRSARTARCSSRGRCRSARRNVTEQAGFKFEVRCRTAAADEGGKPLKRFLIGVADAQERNEMASSATTRTIGRNHSAAAPSATASASRRGESPLVHVAAVVLDAYRQRRRRHCRRQGLRPVDHRRRATTSCSTSWREARARARRAARAPPTRPNVVRARRARRNWRGGGRAAPAMTAEEVAAAEAEEARRCRSRSSSWWRPRRTAAAP